MSKADETIQRIKSKKGVGMIITDNQNKIIRSNFHGENERMAELLRNSIPHLTSKARNIIRDLDPSNDLLFLRIKTKTNEFMVAPSSNNMLISVQNEQKMMEK